jgi:hypothetical protein
MGKQELENLVKIQRLKTEPPTRSEYDGMLESARKTKTPAVVRRVGKGALGAVPTIF